ncbi:MAG: VanZ family protein [Pyrinomonadaceae bacterium]|nr:VanZ family protein [Pyrinomonadaceae bacterium]
MSQRVVNDWRGGLWAFAPLAVWIVVVFAMSSSSASMAETSRFIGPLVRWIYPDISPETLKVIHVGVRKLAHIFEYSVLAFLSVRAFSLFAGHRLSNWRYLVAIIPVVVVASLDEYRQSFDVTRTGTIDDALLDITSGMLVIVLLWIARRPRLAGQERSPGI